MLRFVELEETHRMGSSEARLNLSPFLHIHCSCDESLHGCREQLTRAGLRFVQTFDLHAARVGMSDCSCPNHGTDDCDCQLVVLLVYGNEDEPVTLTLHGSNEETWLSMAESANQRSDVKLSARVKRTLEKLSTHAQA